MSKILSGLFGGGSAILYILLIAIIGGFYLEYHNAKADAARFQTERDAWKGTALGHSAALRTLSVQATRKTTSQKEATHAADLIHSVPDARNCLESQPVRTALDWMRDYRARRPETDPNAADVPLRPQTETTATPKP